MKLLSIVELGGYGNLNPLYESLGFEVQVVHNMRKAMKLVKSFQPQVIVAEFNYQTDFRDRSSTLESLMATLHWEGDIKVIALYDKEWSGKLEAFQKIHPLFKTVPFPIDETSLAEVLQLAKQSMTD